ncbi:MAG: MFS transporter [Ruminococcus sp.]|uniref:MFS transporter n=1 Tax=Ruminococcus sp. TaxID=41978 RepID=UPI0025E980CB|nr:MFS transporter [Ruminococcus sp.]MCR5599806.1 MFS transporter [Ruminococcus sp.]
MKYSIKHLKYYLLLWSTQSASALGSSMTSYALVLWLYMNSGSALKTAMLTICSYTPYVLMSIFAGALSDKWNKKRTMLVCDLFAAMTTAAAFILIKSDSLQPWHLYVINALNGLMNTVQQPASEVASTQLIPKEYYQKTSGLRSFSQSLNSLLTPVLATILFTFGGISAVMSIDLITFAAAFTVLLLFIHIPEPQSVEKSKETLLASAKAGLAWLRKNTLVLKLIFFLAGINLIASAHTAALPAMLLSKASGGKNVLGAVNFFAGAASLAGSMIASFAPAPKNRVRAICLSLFFAMSTENFLLAFADTPAVWYIGASMGWLLIPYMGANLDVIFRSTIPADMQGRVYSCRNTLQFFTIPIGYLSSGFLIDNISEPFMSQQSADSIFVSLFGMGKGSGAAMLFAVLGAAGVAVCTVFSAILRKEKA